jgi:hypothetical protein
MKYIELNAWKAVLELYALLEGTTKQCITCMMINYNFYTFMERRI